MANRLFKEVSFCPDVRGRVFFEANDRGNVGFIFSLKPFSPRKFSVGNQSANLRCRDVLAHPFHEGYAFSRVRIALFVEHLEADQWLVFSISFLYY